MTSFGTFRVQHRPLSHNSTTAATIARWCQSFFNPEEGTEDFTGYYGLCAALGKRGKDLSEGEHDVARGFVRSPAIGPAFVKRMPRDFPPDALFAQFGIPPETPPPYARDRPFRCWKGRYYRPRYPAVSAV